MVMQVIFFKIKQQNNNISYIIQQIFSVIKNLDFCLDNTNPCIEESSGILRMLLPRMLDDAFKLTIDVIFPPKQKLEIVESTFPVNKYSNTESLWESIGNLESPKPAAKQSAFVLPNQLSQQIQQFQTVIPIYQGDL